MVGRRTGIPNVRNQSPHTDIYWCRLRQQSLREYGAMTMTKMKRFSLLCVLFFSTTLGDDAPCVCDDQCAQMVADRVLQAEAKLTEVMEAKLSDLTQTIQTLQETLVTKQNEVDDSQRQIQKLDETIQEHAQVTSNLEVTIQTTMKDLTMTQTTLLQVTEREERLKQETQELLATMKEEIQDLATHKTKAATLKENVDTLMSDLDSHRSMLKDTTHKLTKEVDRHKALLDQSETNSISTRQELFAAQERMRHLHDQVTSTYINTTLIYDDTRLVLHKGREKFMEVCMTAKESVAPTCEAVSEALTPVLQQAKEVYEKYVFPHAITFSAKIDALYSQYAKEIVHRDIMPVVEPVLETMRKYSIKGHALASAGVEQVCNTAHFYLEQSEVYDGIVSSFAFCSSNGSSIIDIFLWGILAIFAFHMIRPAKKGKKQDWMGRPNQGKKTGIPVKRQGKAPTKLGLKVKSQ